MDKITIIPGLAGTGKSFRALELAEAQSKTENLNDWQVVYLAFNRKLAKDQKSKVHSFIHNDNISTIHSFCFSALKRNGKLPAGFEDESKVLSIEDARKLNKNVNFDSLVEEFLKLNDEEVEKGYPEGISIIILDEYQDFSILHKKVVKRLVSIFHSDLFVAIDQYQQIYSFTNKKKEAPRCEDNILTLKSDYPKRLIRTLEPSTTGWRFANDDSVSAINSTLLTLYGQVVQPFLYTIRDGATGTSTKPIVASFKDYASEAAFILKEIKNLQTKGIKKIGLLTRANHELSIMVKNLVKLDPDIAKLLFIAKERPKTGRHFPTLCIFEDDDSWGKRLNTDSLVIEASTIHVSKGNEFQAVFLTCFDFNEALFAKDPTEKNVLYVAMTRFREYLYITSSYPMPKLPALFDKSLFEFQKDIANANNAYVPWVKFKRINESKHFSLKKINTTMIHSVELAVKSRDQPFGKKVVQNQWQQDGFHVAERHKLNVNIPIDYTIKLHKSSYQIAYEFMDINVLIKSGFNARMVLRYLTNIVETDWNNDLALSSISIKRLDLSYVLQFRSNEDRKAFEKWFGRYIDRARSYYNCDIAYGRVEDEHKNLRGEMEEKDFSKTVYVNHRKRENIHKKGNPETTTFVFYEPDKKQENFGRGNVYHGCNPFKIEARLFEEDLRFFGIENMEKLNEVIDREGIFSIFKKCYCKYYYNPMKEFKVSRVPEEVQAMDAFKELMGFFDKGWGEIVES
jgi:hypothetical protein